MSIHHIVGACAQNQAAYNENLAELFKQAYDQFFVSIGAVGPNNGFYVSSASESENSKRIVKIGHRVRTKLKRETKTAIANSVLNSWAAFSRQPQDIPAFGAAVNISSESDFLNFEKTIVRPLMKAYETQLSVAKEDEFASLPEVATLLLARNIVRIEKESLLEALNKALRKALGRRIIS
jgi:hypothetical protein